MEGFSLDNAFRIINEGLTLDSIQGQALVDSFRKILTDGNKFSDVHFSAGYDVCTDGSKIELKITYSREKVLKYEALKKQKEYLEEELKQFESESEAI